MIFTSTTGARGAMLWYSKACVRQHAFEYESGAPRSAFARGERLNKNHVFFRSGGVTFTEKNRIQPGNLRNGTISGFANRNP